MATPGSKPFKDATRAQLSLLAPLEKRALLWLAARMPAAVNSDHLTLLGFVSLIGAGLSYWYARTNPLGLVFVIAFLITNWFGDSLDGTLARYRQRLRPRYGFYVDHMVDAFGALFLLGGAIGVSAAAGFEPARDVLSALHIVDNDDDGDKNAEGPQDPPKSDDDEGVAPESTKDDDDDRPVATKTPTPKADDERPVATKTPTPKRDSDPVKPTATKKSRDVDPSDRRPTKTPTPRRIRPTNTPYHEPTKTPEEEKPTKTPEPPKPTKTATPTKKPDEPI